jgi:hypothetical protein
MVLGTGSLIKGSMIDTTSAPFNTYLTTPLQVNVSGANTHEMTDMTRLQASILETDQLKSVQGSLQLAIEVGDNMEFVAGKDLRFAGDAKLTSQTGVFKLDTLPAASVANVIGYNPTTGALSYQAAGGGGGGTVNSVVAGTGITVDNTDPANPVVAATGIQTITAGTNIGVSSGTSPTIDLNITSNVDMNTYQLHDSGNIVFSQTVGDARLDGCKEVKAFGGANLNLNVDGGGDLLFTTNANQRGSCTQNGVWSFNTFPQVSGTPGSGNDLVNKTYADGKVASVSAVSPYIGVAGTATAPTVALNYTPTTRMFYVSPQGSDVSGNGSALLPYATIQTAVSAAEAVASSVNPCLVSVALGTYTETITFGKGYVGLIGTTDDYRAYAQMPQLLGGIVVNLTGSNDLFGRQVSISNMVIRGSSGINDNTASTQHTLTIKNCYLFTSGSAAAVYVGPNVADQRTYVQNCFINQTSSSTALDINAGWLDIIFSEITQTSNAPCITAQQFGIIIRSLGNTFQSTSAPVANAAPIVRINTTSVAAAHTFSNCGFVYSSATGKLAGFSSGIYAAGSANITIVCTFCFFSLAGTSNPTFHAIEVAGAGPVVVYAGNYGNGINAYKISAAATKLAGDEMS